MNFFFLLFTAAVLLEPCFTLEISRCDLAKGLIVRGIPKDKINDWICLAESESMRNTKTVKKEKPDGSWGYGIFQVII
uniref:lysozyme n=1 Tax=Strigamia maritima TaxID=126957 RepID=T1IKI6_STRMM